MKMIDLDKQLSTIALKPCPLCGQRAIGWQYNGLIRISCIGNSALHSVWVASDDFATAVKLWNRRADNG